MASKMIGELLGMSRLSPSSNASFTLLFLPSLINPALPLCVSPASTLAFQNKCVRYWPDLHGTKEFGKVLVRNVDERPAQDYILRKLEVTRLDRVRRTEGWVTTVASIIANPLTRGQIIWLSCVRAQSRGQR